MQYCRTVVCIHKCEQNIASHTTEEHESLSIYIVNVLINAVAASYEHVICLHCIVLTT